MFVLRFRLKAARLDNIFLTRLSWENVGGLSGQTHTDEEDSKVHGFDWNCFFVITQINEDNTI